MRWPEMYQVARRTGRAPLLDGYAPEVLEIGVHLPVLFHQNLVGQIVDGLQDQQGGHQPYRVGGTALVGIQRGEFLFKIIPIDLMCQKI